MESGYGRPRPSHNAALTEVGPGKRAIDAVGRGEDPPGLVRAPAHDVLVTIAGNAVVSATAGRS